MRPSSAAACLVTLLVGTLVLAGCRVPVDLLRPTTPPAWRGIIKIGIVAPFSGPMPTNGISLLQGARLAAAEVNQAGGVAGYRLELLVADEANDRSAPDLVADPDLVAVVGHLWSRDLPGSVYARAGVAWLAAGPIGVSEKSDGNPYPLVAPAKAVRQAVAQYLASSAGATGADASAAVAACVDRAGRGDLATEVGAVTVICADRPENLISTLDRRPVNSRVVCSVGCDTPDLDWWSARLNLTSVSPVALPSPLSAAGRHLSARLTLDRLSPYVGVGYDGVEIVAAAIATAQRSGHPGRALVKLALAATAYTGVLGHYGSTGNDAARADIREGLPGSAPGLVGAPTLPLRP